MKKLIAVLVLAGVGLTFGPAPADEIWSCDRDGRLAGRRTGTCQADLEAGSYELSLVTSGREASGDIEVTIAETGAPRIDLRCYALANAIVSCEANGGTLDSSPLGTTLTFAVNAATIVSFQVSPHACGTVTCNGRDPVVSAGKIRASISTVA